VFSKDGSGDQGEAIAFGIAFLTLPVPRTRPKLVYLLVAAARTDDAVRPPASLEIGATMFLIRERASTVTSGNITPTRAQTLWLLVGALTSKKRNLSMGDGMGFSSKGIARTLFVPRHLFRFVVVGSLGFVTDSGILLALVHGLNWNPFRARILAIAVAVLLSWTLHRRWTFVTGRIRHPIQQWLLFGAIQFTGISINYSVFSLLVLYGGIWRSHLVLSVAAGVLAAMWISYLGSSCLAFADPRQPLFRKTPVNLSGVDPEFVESLQVK
jgi:putative flippase GtrA